MPEVDHAVKQALQAMLLSAADERTAHLCGSVLGVPGCRLVAVDGANYLFALRQVLREEHQEFRLFAFGRLLEIRRIFGFTPEFSMVEFPRDLVPFRSRIESRFAELWRMTDEGAGWGGRDWETLTPEQRANVACRFVEDDQRYFDI